MHLKETAEKLNITFYELNYIYRVRWISSEFQAISNFNKMWKLVVIDLIQIRDNRRNFDADVRNKASSLLASIKGKHFLVILNFIYDVLEHLSFWSKKMQERAALLADFVEFKDKIIQTFESLKNEHGKGMKLLLEHCTCDDEICETIEQYYSSETVKYYGVPLLNDRGADEDIVPYLYEIREFFWKIYKVKLITIFR